MHNESSAQSGSTNLLSAAAAAAAALTLENIQILHSGLAVNPGAGLGKRVKAG
jgi:hypothetical protein